MAEGSTCPSLPDDKLYHALFSFHSDDRSWVRAALEGLESTPYNLKCCFADRDFHPGKDILQNIEICMQKSMNIVLVISPEHAESTYCDYETNMAMELAHEKKGKLIPVLRRGEQVPSSLRFINYIDAREGVNQDEILEKLARAILEGVDERTISTSYNFMDQGFVNGEEICISPPKIRCCMSPFCSLSYMTPQQLDDCKHLGIKLTQGHASAIQLLVDGCMFVRDYRMLYTHFGRFLLWGFLGLFMYTSTLVIVTKTGMAWDNGNINFGMSLIFSVGFPASALAFPVVLFPLRCIAKKQKEKMSGILSQHSYRRKLLVCIGNERNDLVLRLIRYDVINCQEYIRINLVPAIVTDEDQTDTEELVQIIIKAALPDYVKLFMVSGLAVPRTRHRVRRDIPCLCQFVESKMLRDNVFGSLSSPSSRGFTTRIRSLVSVSRPSVEDDSINLI